jgi:hypothetical protein
MLAFLIIVFVLFVLIAGAALGTPPSSNEGDLL